VWPREERVHMNWIWRDNGRKIQNILFVTLNFSNKRSIYLNISVFSMNQCSGRPLIWYWNTVLMKESQCFKICPSSLFCAGYIVFKQNYGSMSMLPNTKSVERSHLGKCQAMTVLSQIPPNTPFIIILSLLIQNYIWDLRFYWQWLWRVLASGMWHRVVW
jgi:hypothetical protein